MLKPEAAQKQLKQWLIETDSEEARFLPAVKKLPKKLRAVGFAVLYLNAKGEDGDWQEAREFRAEQFAAFDKFTKTERMKVWKLFFGPLAKDVETAWTWLPAQLWRSDSQGPYFRAEKNLDLTRDDRFSFLTSLLNITRDIDHSVLTAAWLAAWAPHLSESWRLSELGLLFAAVIDAKGKTGNEVFDILCASAKKEHEIGGMGEHVSVGLLRASRKDGWELMEKMLLAAQRQEGLRQVLLNSVGGAHPDAFCRMLRIVIDQKLVRFSSVTLALNEWLGFQWAAKATKKVHDTLEELLRLTEKPAARKGALSGDSAEDAYLALWAAARFDVAQSVKLADKLLKHKDVEMRFVAASHLAGVSNGPLAEKALVTALKDDDVRIALMANSGLDTRESEVSPGRFTALESLLEQIPAKAKTYPALVWPWTEQTARKSHISQSLLAALGDLPPTRLIPHLKSFDGWTRSSAIRQLGEQKKWDKLTRETIFKLCGDTSSDARSSAFEALKNVKVTAAECESLEPLLKRKSADVRAGVIDLTLRLNDKQALTAGQRLMESGDKQQRLAGLEIVRQLAEEDRGRDACMQCADEWANARKRILKDEQVQLDAISASNEEKLTLDDGLGLFDPANRTPRVPPQTRKVRVFTPAAANVLKSLDALIHKHREEPTTYERWKEVETKPLGEIGYGFPTPDPDKPARAELKRLPLKKIWQDWCKNRPANCIDSDGFECLRAYVLMNMDSEYSWREGPLEEFRNWTKKSKNRKAVAKFVGADSKTKIPKLRYRLLVREILRWTTLLVPTKGYNEFILDVVESIYAQIPEEDIQVLTKFRDQKRDRWSDDDDDDDDVDIREFEVISIWQNAARFFQSAGKPTKAFIKRNWELTCWQDEPVDGASRCRAGVEDFIVAHSQKLTNDADFIDYFLGPDNPLYGLRQLTERRAAADVRAFLQKKPVAKLLTTCTNRLYEIELARGEAATVSTQLALAVNTWHGIARLRELLKALGKTGFKEVRGWKNSTEDNRFATFTEMVKCTWPTEDETSADFAKEMRAGIRADEFPEERLLQLAFLAPQWTEFIEAALKWDGFTEALYWYMAHMKYVYGMGDAFEDDSDEEEDIPDDDDEKPRKLTRWERIIAERTPLTEEERSNGAIDVAWFHRTYEQLTPKRWEAMAAAAKFATSSASAKRAQMIGDVLLGKVAKSKLVTDIRKRHLKENVRLLGLLPLAKGKQTEKDLMDRYEVLQEYRRYANGLSSMSRPDAVLACEIGMKNLASTAGYVDPMRLQWALEAESTKDVAAGPIVVSKGDVSLTLSLDDRAEPGLVIRRGDKVLKSLPKTVNKDKKFVELRERNKHLKRQASRVKQSLEVAMIRGDNFTGNELMALSDHAILWPQLQRLVLVGEGIMGYPVKRGKALENHAGKLEPVKKAEQLRIAHPHDLLKSKHWSKWQHECFAHERLQPFKQVFRELYVVTKQERTDKTFSARYAGQQVNPRQAYALWGRRGWQVDEYSNVMKVFHDEGLTVSVSFNHGYTTPLEVEGLTIENIEFQNRATYKAEKIASVPPRLFSEVMRDMDLIVSVAHAGDVDPEATASTVEMRESLLKETCKLLKLKNVTFKNSRASIKGHYANYTVHLGSGVVHKMPGGSVCLVPVHAQHRGRLFLPFADDDPRTAEVVAKTLMLSRDKDIDDPILLDQLR